MIMYVHCVECNQCKKRDQFYAGFNSDSKKDVHYFGVISFLYYLFLTDFSFEESKKFLKDRKNISLFQIRNEWSVRERLQKRIGQEKKLTGQYFKEDNEQHWTSLKKKAAPQKPLYSPELMGNLITIKKSESSSELSPEDTVSSNSLKKIYNPKLKRKGRSKKRVADSEPTLGTIKRKRFNFKKLKENGIYEDDMYGEMKLKCASLADIEELNSEKDSIKTPRWSLPISPIEQSQTPSYEDCFSPTEFQSSRKEAEEYQYRRNKRRKYMRTCKILNAITSIVLAHAAP